MTTNLPPSGASADHPSNHRESQRDPNERSLRGSKPDVGDALIPLEDEITEVPKRTLIFHRIDPSDKGSRLSSEWDTNPDPAIGPREAENANHANGDVSEPEVNPKPLATASKPRFDQSIRLPIASLMPEVSQTEFLEPKFSESEFSEPDVFLEETSQEQKSTATGYPLAGPEMAGPEMAGPEMSGPQMQEPEMDVQVTPKSPKRKKHKQTDPLLHSVMMLATVLAMLAAARFIVPGIVEEIRYAQHRGQLRAEFEVAGEGLKNVSLDTISQAYQMVTAAAGPSVVHIDVSRSTTQARSHADVPGAPMIPISDQGSGVVVDSEGYILTNRHVIADGEQISVTLSDGRVVDAVVIGTDPLTDLAVLKVQADRLFPIPWGDSERVRVGSPVWAIGSPFGLDRTVTFGILSGKHRIVRASDRYQDFMQSDVAVNPGNSGGPLVDSHGTLIGINTAIVGETYQGVSFAIPSEVAKKIYLQLRESGQIERGWLGVSLAEVPVENLIGDNHRVRGALIVQLADKTSGAARAGLKAGDIVVQVDGEAVRDVNHLMQVIGNAMAGTRIHLNVLRKDASLEFDVTLGFRP